ncbi:MAG TPA: CBASS cGAMP-activated phospholipase [Bryobacteraceae bacterium]|nr:CBASS cGAMP-activated phospholipase [Bryobacteraceae bacterium]
MNNLVKVLSIDGGGIRGIIPAVILAEIERRTNRPIASLFDLIAGTSTGGILALGLTVPKSHGGSLYSAEQLVNMYQHKGSRIFSRSPLRTVLAVDNLTWKKYSSTGIEQVLLEYFGDSRLRDAVTELLIPSYELERRLPFFFRSANARLRPDYDFPARDVARATSAAPSYFEPLRLLTGTPDHHYTLIDGGVFANNPAACALVEARTTHPNASGYLMVSLGTGTLTRTLPLGLARYWGTVRWAKPLLDVVFDGVSSTVDYQLRQLLPVQHYYRFQVALNGHNHGLDNASADNIKSLTLLAKRLIKREEIALDKLCDALTTSPLQTA